LRDVEKEFLKTQEGVRGDFRAHKIKFHRVMEDLNTQCPVVHLFLMMTSGRRAKLSVNSNGGNEKHAFMGLDPNIMNKNRENGIRILVVGV
jgi:hypothetical protein